MTSKEKKGFDQWLSAHASQPEADGALKKLWDLTGSYKKNYEPDVDKGLAAFQQRLAQSQNTQARVVRMNPAAKLLRIAAAVLVLLVAGFVVKNYLLNPANSTETVAAEANSVKSIPLSDGTLVTLNQNGTLEFPENFTGNERRVRLEGEAFFEVAHNPAKPFVLETNSVEVTVLGTSFNVRSFPNEASVQVYVKTGKVQVKLLNSGKTYNLTPGDRLVFPKKEKTASVSAETTSNALGWKEGKLRFKETPLKEILAQVQQQFGVAFDTAGASRLDCPFTISIEQKNWKDALQALAASCPLEFVQAGENKIRVSGRCCE